MLSESRNIAANATDKVIGEGQGIPFKDGYPDFSKWSKHDLEVPGLTGKNSTDQALANKVFATQQAELQATGKQTVDDTRNWLYQGKPNANEAERYMAENGLIWHHKPLTTTEVQAVPVDIHRPIRHTGSSSDIRNTK